MHGAAELEEVAETMGDAGAQSGEAEGRGERSANGRVAPILDRGFAEVIIDTTSALIVLLDTEGRIARFNAACQRLTGYSEDEVRGQPIFELLLPESERDGVRDVFRETLSGRTAFDNYWLTRGGDLRLIAWANAPVTDASGEVQWVVGTGIDVTEHRRMEEQLRRAARLEAVGQLAGGVAHDFNNLLTAILGYLDLNIPTLDPDSALCADLRQVKQAAKRASDLTRQLLAFSRLQPCEPRLVDLSQAVQEVSAMLRHLIEENVETKLTLAEQPLAVEADPAQIGQVVMNLAVNARDAMPEGGTLSIGTSIERLDAARALAHAGRAPGEYACLSVSDNGVGMSEATRERMFDPFFTTKEVGKGTGLGMSTVYGIVEQHDGFIECESEPGVGTTVSIYLPLAGGSSDVTGESSVLDFGLVGTETLLLVEDDPGVRKLTARVLEDCGYTVLTAGDGREALRAAGDRDGDLHLLITDVVMPNLSGIELAQRVKMDRPGLQVLFTSGYSGAAPDGPTAGLHPDTVLQKPFRASELVRRVREVLDGA